VKASERAESVERTGRARRRPDVPRGAVTAADGILVVDKPQGLTSHDVVGAGSTAPLSLGSMTTRPGRDSPMFVRSCLGTQATSIRDCRSISTSEGVRILWRTE